ncbi:MAG TPA: toxin-antitoxin system HicB family antitoxin [Spirochaetota bacterium]|nr:toxin-antitoxin system HicB family antitoxin [Spirochaetota bacterium]HNT12298.1 toxin-antitoxin system HicB family antitoxin [Spirochaetota bacterium]
MKAKSSMLTIRVPRALKTRIERVADEQGVSINQLALYAFTKEITEMESASYFSSLRKSKSKKQLYDDFDSVMKKVGSVTTPKWDKL